MEQTLLLNACYTPLKIVNWQRAITLVYQGKAELVAPYDDREIRGVRITLPMPAVVRLLRFVRVRTRAQVPFTRMNLYARDNGQCAYCGDSFEYGDLTYDHVVPVAQGGRREWTNIVTACIECNRTKGARTPQEAGMPLRFTPRRPVVMPTLRVTVGVFKQPKVWGPWLYGNIEVEP